MKGKTHLINDWKTWEELCGENDIDPYRTVEFGIDEGGGNSTSFEYTGDMSKKEEWVEKYKDRCFRDFDWILDQIMEENARQVDKWGVQTHSAFEWLTYTTEELGELAKAISEHEYRKGSKEKVVAEAIQVATLALKIAEMFNHLED